MPDARRPLPALPKKQAKLPHALCGADLAQVSGTYPQAYPLRLGATSAARPIHLVCAENPPRPTIAPMTNRLSLTMTLCADALVVVCARRVQGQATAPCGHPHLAAQSPAPR